MKTRKNVRRERDRKRPMGLVFMTGLKKKHRSVDYGKQCSSALSCVE